MIGRQALVQRVGEVLDSGHPVALMGEAGSGKSALLAAVAGQLPQRNNKVTSVITINGADAIAGIPLIPCAPLLGAVGMANAEPLEVMAKLPRLVASRGIAVCVDDLHALDQASSVLIDHVAKVGGIVCATATIGQPIPAFVASSAPANAQGKSWEQLLVEPLDADAVVQLATNLLGAEPSVTASAALIERAQGLPRAVVELIEVARVGAVATPVGVDLGPSLTTLAATRGWAELLGQLEPEAVAVVEQLAVVGHLPLEVPAARELTMLRQRELVTVDQHVTLRSPDLQGAVLASLTPPLRQQRAAQAHAAWQAQARTSDPHVTYIAALAGVKVPSGEALEASRALMSQGDATHALLVVQAAEHTSPALEVVRAAALSAQERLGEALEVLDRLEPDSDQVAMDKCRELGLLLAVRMHDPAGAVERVSKALERCKDRQLRAVGEGELVKWRLMAGLPGTNPAGLTPEAGADLQVGLALIQAMVASLDGPPHAAHDVVAQGRAALAFAKHPARHAEELLALSEFLATSFDAKVASAESKATARRQAALASGDSAVGLWEYVSAELALHAGRYDAAQTFADRAVPHLVWRDFTGLRASAIALRAALLARRGHVSAATESLSELPEGAQADIKVALHVARVTAERLRRRGNLADAIATLNEAAAVALEQSHRNLGIMMLDEAWMLSPTPAASKALLEHSDAGRLAALLAARVSAFEAGDVSALESLAKSLVEIGMPGRAAHIAEHAAQLLDDRGSRSRARQVRATAKAALAFHHAHAWPTLEEDSQLTQRERDIATLAAARIRSKEIAARTGLSVRTVDNHLGKIFRKLGINSRDELAAALDQAEANATFT